MLATTPYEALIVIRMKAVMEKAMKDTSCAGPAGSTSERTRRNMIMAVEIAARYTSQPIFCWVEVVTVGER